MAKITKVLKAAAVAACASGLASNVAMADSNFSYYWTITGASDYMFRGISYTQEEPTINSYVELDYNTNSFFGTAYLGFWTSNIDYAPSLGPWEQDIYLGIRPITGCITWDIAALWYIYGNKNDGIDPLLPDGVWSSDYVEFKAAATTSPITNLTVGATVYYAPDQGYGTTENVSVEGSLAYTLPQFWILTPTVGGLYGYSDSGTNFFYPTGYWLGDESYAYWNAGVKLTVEKFFMDLRYWDTDNEDPFNTGWADERFVFSAGVTLP